jgi:hypothetical protein
MNGLAIPVKGAAIKKSPILRALHTNKIRRKMGDFFSTARVELLKD